MIFTHPPRNRKISIPLFAHKKEGGGGEMVVGFQLVTIHREEGGSHFTNRRGKVDALVIRRIGRRKEGGVKGLLEFKNKKGKAARKFCCGTEGKQFCKYNTSGRGVVNYSTLVL